MQVVAEHLAKPFRSSVI